jgi:hypothetical protein
VRSQIGEAADRRHTAPIASAALWVALSGFAVIGLHTATAEFGSRLGSYQTGILTLSAFALTATYTVRKYSLWLSARWLRPAMRLPRPLALRIILLDRLESWRTLHIVLGMFVLLPFWWHTDVGRATMLELVLKNVVFFLILSGIVATAIEQFQPPQMRKRPNQQVRVEDVEQALHTLYVEAEERILGHSEALVHAYLRHVRPILTGFQPLRRMLWATLTSIDPAPAACAGARHAAVELGPESSIFNDLIDIAERKVRLEHNQFDLLLSSNWLRLHRGLAIMAAILIAFHVMGVLYFAGL